MLRLRQIAFVARKLAPVERTIREVLGLEVAFRDPMVATWGLENAVFPLGHQFLEVVAPTTEGTAGGRQLDRRGGDGGYMVILQCDDQSGYRDRAAGLSVRTAFEFEDRGYRCWQLHPRDTGGAFLEIDVQGGGEDMKGPWHPAGREWQNAIRTGVVKAIAAAEIQAADPGRLAARWSTILGRPAESGADGATRIRLDNADLRFVADRDGRGEGLGGIDVVLADPNRTLPTEVGGVRVRGVAE
jgi:hypothetical protein